jgi:hypothetical protein
VVLAAVLSTLVIPLAGCERSHPRTEVLRSTSPPTSDIYLRITGPGGAVSYMGQRFTSRGIFARYSFTEARRDVGVFLPPRVRERKLCAATHVIRDGDAPELQQWRGRKLEITVYGDRDSATFCAVLGPALYLGNSY